MHSHVGCEPSGLAFNEISLNKDNLPHNPMINAGAIATGSCIMPAATMSSRLHWLTQQLTDMAGGEPIGFSESTYLCEQETSWRNNALVYMMEDVGVFSRGVNPVDALDFYTQCCSIEVNTSASAVIAATLANAGVCPLSGKPSLSPMTVKSTLSLMFSCGMYDYSGEWCVSVGLPAKSGVAGLIYVVIPNVSQHSDEFLDCQSIL